jgi:hypothetical protein
MMPDYTNQLDAAGGDDDQYIRNEFYGIVPAENL